MRQVKFVPATLSPVDDRQLLVQPPHIVRQLVHWGCTSNHLGQLPPIQGMCRCDKGRPLLTFESKRREFVPAKAAVTVTGARVTGENPVALSATKRAELLVWMDKIPASRIMAPHCTAIVVANAAIRAIRVTSIATVLTAIIVKMFVLFVAVPTPTSY